MTTTLTYFNFDGSRGLDCRLALAAAGVPFDDIRLSREQWMALKPSTPYGALPYLEQDGRRLAQSTAILGYLGRTHGMHPVDPWAAAEHEALMLSVEDLRAKIPDGRGMTDEAKQEAREAFAAGWLSQWARTVSGRVVGPFIEGAGVNVADLKLYVILRSFMGGNYDFIPASFFDDYPKLTGLYAAVDALPATQQVLRPA